MQENQSNDIVKSLQELQQSIDDLKNKIFYLPDDQTTDALQRLLGTLKDVSNKLLTEIQQEPNELQKSKTINKSPINAPSTESQKEIKIKNPDKIAKIQHKKYVIKAVPRTPEQSKIEMSEKLQIKQSIKDNVGSILSCMKTINTLIQKLVNITKHEAMELPKNKWNQLQQGIETQKYNKAKGIVMNELKIETINLTQALYAVQKANELLTALEKKEVKPMNKKSLLGQLKANQAKIEKPIEKTEKTKEASRD